MVSALSPVWFFVALALGVGLTLLVMWIRNNKIVVRWYDYLMGIAGLLLLLLAIQHLAGSLVIEKYTTAGWLGALIFGLPAIILMLVPYFLVTRRSKSRIT